METGKPDRRNIAPEVVYEWRKNEMKKRKGKQPLRGRQGNPEPLSSQTSPSAMIQTMTLNSGSSYANSLAAASPSSAPIAASQSPAPTTAAQAPGPPTLTVLTSPAAAEPLASSLTAEPSAPTSAQPPIPPTATPLFAPESSASPVDLTMTVELPAPSQVAEPSALMDVDSPAAEPSADVAFKRASPFLLRHTVTPERRHTPIIRKPFSTNQHRSAVTSHDDFDERVSTLERRMDQFEEWMRQDEEWKRKDEEWKLRVENLFQARGA